MHTPRITSLLFAILLILAQQLSPSGLAVAKNLAVGSSLRNTHNDGLSQQITGNTHHHPSLKQSSRLYVRRLQKEEDSDSEGLFQLPSEYRTIIIVVIAILALMCFGGLMFCFCCAEMLCSCCGLCDC